MTLLYDTESLFQRGLIKMGRNPTLLVTFLVEPIAFLVLFSQMFTKLGLFLPSHTGYIAYLTPGILVFCALITSPQSGVSIVNDINSGFLSKTLLTQSSEPAILLGRLLTDISLVIAETIITIVVAFLMGVTISSGLPGVILILLTVAFFETGLFEPLPCDRPCHQEDGDAISNFWVPLPAVYLPPEHCNVPHLIPPRMGAGCFQLQPSHLHLECVARGLSPVD